MITIKLPYIAIDKEFYSLLKELQREYSIIVRFAYNRFLENKSEKEIRLFCKNLKNINYLNSWMIQCAIKEGKQIYLKNKKNKVIFGGKQLFLKWIKTKNMKWLNKWKERRLFPLTIQGEKLQKGNRNFELNVINDNEIIFKYNKKQYFKLQLPRLRKNYKYQFLLLEELSKEKKIAYTIKLDTKYIYISFDEVILKQEDYKPIKNRIASIDLNPNYIGFVIKDYDTNQILWKEIISLKDLNNKEKELKRLPSTDKRRKKLNNIRRNMIFEINKRMTNIVKHFQVEAFVVEDLKIKSSNKKKGKNFNKLINNQWLRNSLILNLQKKCNIIGIKFLKIYPQYSSTIGCLMYPNEVDSIASALELGRRGFEFLNYEKGKNVIFPFFDRITLSRQWKDEMKNLILSSKDWKDLHNKIKKSGLKYRFLLSDLLRKTNHDAVFIPHNINSYIKLYQFIL